MTRIRAEVASGAVDLQFERFSPEALRELTEKLNRGDVAISDGFDTRRPLVGRVLSAALTEGRVVVEAEVSSERLEDMFLAPGFTSERSFVERLSDTEEDVHVIAGGLRYVSLALVRCPADPTLRPVQVVEDEESPREH